jgi:hypothetical protein
MELHRQNYLKYYKLHSPFMISNTHLPQFLTKHYSFLESCCNIHDYLLVANDTVLVYARVCMFLVPTMKVSYHWSRRVRLPWSSSTIPSIVTPFNTASFYFSTMFISSALFAITPLLACHHSSYGK